VRNQSGSETKFEEFVRAFQARHPRVVTVLDARRAAYPPAMFVDATHLGGRGAVRLSEAVGGTIETELLHSTSSSVRGWIELNAPPDDRLADVHPGLEDLDRSREILNLPGDSGKSIR
jgi:hypothetical protein